MREESRHSNDITSAQLTAIVEFVDTAIINISFSSDVLEWNRAAELLFGYTAAEAIGKPLSILIPAELRDQEARYFDMARDGNAIQGIETQRLKKDGRQVEVRLAFCPIVDRIGHVVSILHLATLITDRKRLERAERDQSLLASLVSSAEDAIISKTLEGIVTTWNPAAEKLYGYSPAEMIGTPISVLIPSDHPDEEPQILERIRRGERIEHYETKRVRKDGGVIDVAITVSPIKDGLGRIIGASKIARDVTAQKRSEARERKALQEAQTAKRQAEEASRAKDEFLATISHELRTPMTAILGWTRMLITGDVGPDTQQKAIETIDRNARSQAQLIEDLLDVSRIVSGKLRVDFKPVDMGGVIAAAVEAVRPTAEAKRIRVQTILSSNAGPILGDSERLQQVVWNLLSNALRFTPADGLVQIELQRVESQIELRVTDNGVGITPEFLPRIFDRFTQSDASITRSHGGLGMGLAIVKSLVELHGGVVSAASAGPGKGAMFTIKLPVSAIRPQAERPPVQPPALQAAMDDRHDLIGVKILIVDDDPDTCEMLRFVFNRYGAIVEVANSANAALQAFDRWHPDILVSDIGMPEVDGYELIRAIREERRSRIPAVALSAMARIDDRIKALTAGYQMHVAKPVEPMELISIVTSLVALVNRKPAT